MDTRPKLNVLKTLIGRVREYFIDIIFRLRVLVQSNCRKQKIKENYLTHFMSRSLSGDLEGVQWHEIS